MDKLPDWVSFYNSKLKGNAEVKRLGDAINTSPYMATLITEMAMEAVKPNAWDRETIPTCYASATRRPTL